MIDPRRPIVQEQRGSGYDSSHILTGLALDAGIASAIGYVGYTMARRYQRALQELSAMQRGVVADVDVIASVYRNAGVASLAAEQRPTDPYLELLGIGEADTDVHVPFQEGRDLFVMRGREMEQPNADPAASRGLRDEIERMVDEGWEQEDALAEIRSRYAKNMLEMTTEYNELVADPSFVSRRASSGGVSRRFDRIYPTLRASIHQATDGAVRIEGVRKHVSGFGFDVTLVEDGVRRSVVLPDNTGIFTRQGTRWSFRQPLERVLDPTHGNVVTVKGLDVIFAERMGNLTQKLRGTTRGRRSSVDIVANHLDNVVADLSSIYINDISALTSLNTRFVVDPLIKDQNPASQKGADAIRSILEDLHGRSVFVEHYDPDKGQIVRAKSDFVIDVLRSGDAPAARGSLVAVRRNTELIPTNPADRYAIKGTNLAAGTRLRPGVRVDEIISRLGWTNDVLLRQVRQGVDLPASLETRGIFLFDKRLTGDQIGKGSATLVEFDVSGPRTLRPKTVVQRETVRIRHLGLSYHDTAAEGILRDIKNQASSGPVISDGNLRLGVSSLGEEYTVPRGSSISAVHYDSARGEIVYAVDHVREVRLQDKLIIKPKIGQHLLESQILHQGGGTADVLRLLKGGEHRTATAILFNGERQFKQFAGGRAGMSILTSILSDVGRIMLSLEEQRNPGANTAEVRRSISRKLYPILDAFLGGGGKARHLISFAVGDSGKVGLHFRNNLGADEPIIQSLFRPVERALEQAVTNRRWNDIESILRGTAKKIKEVVGFPVTADLIVDLQKEATKRTLEMTSNTVRPVIARYGTGNIAAVMFDYVEMIHKSDVAPVASFSLFNTFQGEFAGGAKVTYDMWRNAVVGGMPHQAAFLSRLMAGTNLDQFMDHYNALEVERGFFSRIPKAKRIENIPGLEGVARYERPKDRLLRVLELDHTKLLMMSMYNERHASAKKTASRMREAVFRPLGIEYNEVDSLLRQEIESQFFQKGQTLEDLGIVSAARGNTALMIPAETWDHLSELISKGRQRREAVFVKLPVAIKDPHFAGQSSIVPISPVVGRPFRMIDRMGREMVTGGNSWQATVNFLSHVLDASHRMNKISAEDHAAKRAVSEDLTRAYNAYRRLVDETGKFSLVRNLTATATAPMSSTGRFYPSESITYGAVGMYRDDAVKMLTNGTIKTYDQAIRIVTETDEAMKIYDRIRGMRGVDAFIGDVTHTELKTLTDLLTKVRAKGGVPLVAAADDGIGAARGLMRGLRIIDTKGKHRWGVGEVETSMQRIIKAVQSIPREAIAEALETERQVVARGILETVDRVADGSRRISMKVSRAPYVRETTSATMDLFLVDDKRMNPDKYRLFRQMRARFPRNADVPAFVSGSIEHILRGDFDSDVYALHALSASYVDELVDKRGGPFTEKQVSMFRHGIGIDGIFGDVNANRALETEGLLEYLHRNTLAAVEDAANKSVYYRPIAPTSYMAAAMANEGSYRTRLQFEGLVTFLERRILELYPGMSAADLKAKHRSIIERVLDTQRSARTMNPTDDEFSLQVLVGIKEETGGAYDRTFEPWKNDPATKLLQVTRGMSDEQAAIYRSWLYQAKDKTAKQFQGELEKRRVSRLIETKTMTPRVYYPSTDIQWLLHRFGDTVGMTPQERTVTDLFADRFMTQSLLQAKLGHPMVGEDVVTTINALLRGEPFDMDKLVKADFSVRLDQGTRRLWYQAGFLSDIDEAVGMNKYIEGVRRERNLIRAVMNGHIVAAKKASTWSAEELQRMGPYVATDVYREEARKETDRIISRQVFGEGYNDDILGMYRRTPQGLEVPKRARLRLAEGEVTTKAARGRVVDRGAFAFKLLGATAKQYSFLEDRLLSLPDIAPEAALYDSYTRVVMNEFSNREDITRSAFSKLSLIAKLYAEDAGRPIGDSPLYGAYKTQDLHGPVSIPRALYKMSDDIRQGKGVDASHVAEFYAPHLQEITGRPRQKVVNQFGEDSFARARQRLALHERNAGMAEMERRVLSEGTAFRPQSLFGSVMGSLEHATGAEGEALSKYAGKLRVRSAALGGIVGFFLGQAFNRYGGDYSVPGLRSPEGLGGEYYERTTPALGKDLEIMMRPHPPKVVPWHDDRESIERAVSSRLDAIGAFDQLHRAGSLGSAPIGVVVR